MGDLAGRTGIELLSLIDHDDDGNDGDGDDDGDD